MRSVVISAVGLIALACSDSSGPLTRSGCDDPAGGAMPLLSLADPIANAGAGSASVTITGDRPRTLTNRMASGGYEVSGAGPGISIIDLVQRDDAGRPVSELFIFARVSAGVGEIDLVPVSLLDLRRPGFDPLGSIAVFAEGYDPLVEDYTSWLVADAGCIRFTEVGAGKVGRVTGSITFDGTWRDVNGQSLSATGQLSATFNAPFLRLATSQFLFRDTLVATMRGSRTTDDTATTVSAFQVTSALQTRLVIVGTESAVPAVHDYWLSLNGVPGTDSIPLSAVAIEDVVAGRAAGSYAAARFHVAEGIPIQIREEELWRSTGGYVKLTNVVRTGPLALCSWVSGRYEYPAVGTTMGTGGGTALGTATVSGTFATIFTTMPQADTVEQSRAASGPRLVSSGPTACPR